MLRLFGTRRFLPAFSLQGRLALLVVATVLPLLAFSLTEIYLRYKTERENFGERTLHLARAVARMVEADHQMRMVGLQALALSPALQAGDVEAFRPVALSFIESQPKGSTLGLADETGQLLLAVGDVPQGVPLPRRRNMTTQQQVFHTGRPTVSNLFTNAITQRHTYTVEVPVVREGRVVYDFGLDPTPAGLIDLLSKQRMEAGWVVSIIDAQGIIVARQPNGDRFVGQPIPKWLVPLILNQPEGVIETVSLEGTPLLTAFSRADPSGWHVAVGVPRALVYGPLRQRGIVILGVGALVLLVSLVSAAWLARRITRPIALLASFAHAAARRSGPLIPAEVTGLPEVDEVGQILTTATLSLRTLADTLEQRVETEVAERVRAEEALRQSQRMEAVGQLTAGIAHDFNNLLQAQMGGLELLLNAVRSQERPTRYARLALACTEKAAKLTNSLLSFSRQQMLRPEAVDTPALLMRLRILLSRTLDPRITLRIDVAAGLASPLADLAQLETALLNLCLNARDAMAGRGGQLLVEACSGTAAMSFAQLPTGLEPGRCIVFVVTDEGSGMDTATLVRVCEPFFTTKGVGKGSGLGLSMVQGFARQSGGELLIESSPGVGTRVAIWLPQAPLSEAGQGRKGSRDEEPPHRQAAAKPRGSGRVLLVDDDLSVRGVIAEALESAGFEVILAGSGEEGMAMLRVRDARFDALVTDYAMPGMTGGELMAAVQRERPLFPGLVITGYAETAQLGEVPKGCKVLHKPFRTDDLVARVVELFNAC